MIAMTTASLRCGGGCLRRRVGAETKNPAPADRAGQVLGGTEDRSVWQCGPTAVVQAPSEIAPSRSTRRWPAKRKRPVRYQSPMLGRVRSIAEPTSGWEAGTRVRRL